MDKVGIYVLYVLHTYTVFIVFCSQFKDFTTDPVNFPTTEMRQFVDQVHTNGQHYGMYVHMFFLYGCGSIWTLHTKETSVLSGPKTLCLQ